MEKIKNNEVKKITHVKNNEVKKMVQCVCVDLETIATFCDNLDCKEYYHSYESDFNIKNREIITKSNCIYEKEDKIKIRIDDTTLRCCLTYQPNRSFTFSKRKYNKQLKENGITPEHQKLKFIKGDFTVVFK